MLAGPLVVLVSASPALAQGALAPGTQSVEVVLTSSNMSRALAVMPSAQLRSGAPPRIPVIDVNDRLRYQSISGVGAALTDTSAWLIHDKLPPSVSSALMESLFGTGGLGLRFIRVPVGASDFTRGGRPYSYDDLPRGHSDPSLRRFSIAHDRAWVIPTLRQALALNPQATVLASLWSPPGWMKANDSLGNRDHLGRLLRKYYRALANYFVKFIRAYAGQGIAVSAITPSNEPGNPTIYPGMELAESAESSLITEQLRPALRRAGLRTMIYGYDKGWASWSMPFAQALIRSPAARELAGIATHCYFGAPTQIAALHRANPSLDEIVSECSPGLGPYPTSEVLISSMRNWASAVGLWNVALDPRGGPVQPPNHGCPGCRGLVRISERTHRARYTIDYYQLGQVSKFVQPGARRVASNNFVHYGYPVPRGVVSAGLDDVAFLNPDGSKVLVAFNTASRPIRFAVRSHRRYFSYVLGPQATGTFVWDRP